MYKVCHTKKYQQHIKFHPNPPQTCEKVVQQVYVFLLPCDLESMSRSYWLVSKCWLIEFNSTYHHTKFESNCLKNSECMPILKFLEADSSYFSWLHNSHLTVVSGCSTWIASPPHQISSHKVQECARKWTNRFCFLLTLCPPPKVKPLKMVKNGRSGWCL